MAITRRILLTVTIASMFALSSCDETSNSQVEKLKSLTDIRYTGDTKTDLQNLCKIGSVVTEVNNDVNIGFNSEIRNQVDQFAEKSDDERVRKVAKGVHLATSLDKTSRDAGEQMIKDTCKAI